MLNREEGAMALSNLSRNRIVSAVTALVWMLLGASGGYGADVKDFKADGKTNVMPVRWDQTSPRIISSPDKVKLERGEILCEMRKGGADTLTAQSMGLIKARTDECFKVVRNYDQYINLMPCTVENKVIRRFQLEGENAGAEAVDFWTRVRILGVDAGYLLRIAHLQEPVKHRFRSFWTLVNDPDQLPGCLDSEKKPCRNDLDVNLGSHQFEPFPANPWYTLHTYTVTVSGKNWLQQAAFHLGAGASMGDVTRAIRNALEKRVTY
jgi:hypothetical protein